MDINADADVPGTSHMDDTKETDAGEKALAELEEQKDKYLRLLQNLKILSAVPARKETIFKNCEQGYCNIFIGSAGWLRQGRKTNAILWRHYSTKRM